MGETVVKQPTRDTGVNGSLRVKSQLPLLLRNLQVKDTATDFLTFTGRTVVFKGMRQFPLRFGARMISVILKKDEKKSR